MNKTFVSIGIDVSKPFLDVYGLGKGHPIRFPNTSEQISALVVKLAGQPVDLIVCEPSGGYERELVASLQQVGLPVAVVNARQVRDFARAKGVLAKTDRLDAKILAEYGSQLRPSPKPSGRSEELAGLITRRRQLVDMLRMERQQHEKARHEIIRASSEEHITWLVEQIEEIEEQIAAAIARNADWKARNAILVSCKGIGPVAAATLVAEMPELGSASHAQVASLAGLAPFNHDSGAMRGQRHIRGGRGTVRNVLYMATVCAIRYNPDIRRFYEKLRKAGKVAKVAITACMRKLLITLNSLLKHNREWTETYAS
jgi:transposase